MSKVVLVTGGFDPLHSGHIEYFKAARELGDHLVVGLNSDSWLERKKGRSFMPIEERVAIVKELACVDEVITFNDDDNTACLAIGYILQTKASKWKVVFANGGDRTNTTTPEYDAWGNHPDVEFAFGVGGEDKKNSSSWILAEWKAPKTERIWGYYRVLHESGKEVKVKELTVDPGKMLSMQRHKERSEHWFVDSGTATVYTLNRATDIELYGVYEKHQSLHIPVGTWHQLSNEHDEPLKLVEIQYGTNCVEEDIERTT
jgi:D-beta-D-heptose 7-phosphate kinase/D-beta-D-heptose 1-phosphate adenosyltransferase